LFLSFSPPPISVLFEVGFSRRSHPSLFLPSFLEFLVLLETGPLNPVEHSSKQQQDSNVVFSPFSDGSVNLIHLYLYWVIQCCFSWPYYFHSVGLNMTDLCFEERAAANLIVSNFLLLVFLPKTCFSFLSPSRFRPRMICDPPSSQLFYPQRS